MRFSQDDPTHEHDIALSRLTSRQLRRKFMPEGCQRIESSTSLADQAFHVLELYRNRWARTIVCSCDMTWNLSVQRHISYRGLNL